MYLKPILFTVCFLSVTFIGMQVVVKMRANEAASKRAAAKKAAREAEEQVKQAEASTTKAKPNSPAESSPQTPPKTREPAPNPGPPVIINAESGPPQNTSVPQSGPAKTVNTRSVHTTDMYYEPVDVGKNGVPSRVWIRNTLVKDCLILLVGGSSSDGRLYSRKGMTTGAQKHHWEVRVQSGHITVLWDGQPVAPAASIKGLPAR